MTGPPIAMSGQDIVIPDKTAFKASEVCEIAKVQPYVLRSWENEFPELGVSRTPGGPRVYRKTDVERVLQIRHLVLAEGLTLAGVRRKLEGAGVTPAPAVRPPNDEDRALLREVMTPDIKARLSRIRDGLQSLVEMLSRDPLPTGEFHLEALAQPGAPMVEAPTRAVR
ncbi:MAG: MerR family transcriptional regulator, partial [Vicinamibacteraceae bacterium]